MTECMQKFKYLFMNFSSITVDKLRILDSEAYDEVKSKYGDNIPKKLYFNKGL